MCVRSRPGSLTTLSRERQAPPQPVVRTPDWRPSSVWSNKEQKRQIQPLLPPKPQDHLLFRVKQPSSSPLLLTQWKNLLAWILPRSQLLQSIEESQNPELHFARLLDQFSANTLHKYFAALICFFQTCDDMRLQWHQLTAADVSDILLAMRLSRHGDASVSTGVVVIKAARWLQRLAEISSLEVFHSSLVASFLKSSVPCERRKSLPLNLWTVLKWEHRVLHNKCPQREVILLGCFLFMTWTGLRFADLQRVESSSLELSSRGVCGGCWKTKTSNRGQPFGALSSGFLSAGSFAWLFKFLSVWDEFVFAAAGEHIDFMLPSISISGDAVLTSHSGPCCTQKRCIGFAVI